MKAYRQPSYSSSAFGGGAIPPGVKSILIACGAVFLLELIAGPALLSLLGFQARLAVGRLCVWQFATYIFVHDPYNWLHILFNMFMLWMFGRRLEERWGTAGFWRFFLVCGIGAAVVHLLATILFRSPDRMMIGASGAIYGILLAYALYWGEEVVYFNFVIPIKIKYMVLILGGIELFSSLSQPGGGGGVAHFTHLGGLLTAWLVLRGGGWDGTALRLRQWIGLHRGPRPVHPPRRPRPRRPSFDDDTWR